MKKIMLKKAAISSLALLTLAGGATSAFADNGKSKYKGNDHDDHKEEKGRGWDDRGDDDSKGSIRLNFKDEKELKWALEHIMRLASKGVFNGYEDGTFKPQQKITRIEALTAAVRLMGLRDKAESAEEMKTKLNFKDADLIAKKYPWAVGYVAVALENDLFAETDEAVQPNKPADRLWAATLLVKALKLDAEAKAKNNTELSFKDARNIPAGSIGYIAVALEKGLITGYNDNTFRPNQPVTRAELAALLDRTDTQLPDHDAQAITGKLKAAAAGNAIIVTKADNSEVTLQLDANVFVFRDGVKSAVTALKAGDTVLLRTYQNKAIFIEVTQNAPTVVSFTETGTINSVSFNTQGKLATISLTKEVNGSPQAMIYNVDANVTITGNASLLTAGQTVEVKGASGSVSSIVIK
jgi:hypothetical protein